MESNNVRFGEGATARTLVLVGFRRFCVLEFPLIHLPGKFLQIFGVVRFDAELLNASQRAVIALTVLPLLEKEAKERQRAGRATTNGGSAHQCATLLPRDEKERGRAVEQAARLLGASPRYIQAAKQVRRFCPDLLFHIVQGKINLIDAQLAAKLPNPQRQVILDRISQSPRGVPLRLRRLIQEDLAFLMGREVRLSDPPWIGRNAKEKDLDFGPAADWEEVRYIIWNKQLAALDSGEEIPFPIAGRPCLVRLNPNPTQEQIADAEGTDIQPRITPMGTD